MSYSGAGGIRAGTAGAGAGTGATRSCHSDWVCSADRGAPGPDPRGQCRIIPNRSDLFTAELLPTKLLEYVALHVPVIAARTPGIETYFDENMVQFFKPEDVNALRDAIIYFYESREQREQLAKASARFNHKYSWSNIAGQYLAVVQSLANSSLSW
ncbi:MAG TPA: glycosyltransferase [Anaerolineales bacterium]|nr:glycosyltransferase [Anaerolineales bacterium]